MTNESDSRLKVSDYSKSERYMAFLMQALPSLQQQAIFQPHEKINKYQRSAALERTLDKVPNARGLFLEFGVYKGATINLTARRCPRRRIYGFDSFAGFPDDGRPDWQQDFSTAGLPRVPSNVTLIKGWFSDTLQPFLDQTPDPIDFINIDCDIYSSTKFVFDALLDAGRLTPGVVIFFDEIINHRTYLWNEMLAFFEMLEKSGLGFEWVATHQYVRLIPDSIRMLKSGAHPTWPEDLASGYRQQASIRLTDRGMDYGDLLWNPVTQKLVRTLAREFDALTLRRDQSDEMWGKADQEGEVALLNAPSQPAKQEAKESAAPNTWVTAAHFEKRLINFILKKILSASKYRKLLEAPEFFFKDSRKIGSKLLASIYFLR